MYEQNPLTGDNALKLVVDGKALAEVVFTEQGTMDTLISMRPPRGGDGDVGRTVSPRPIR